MSVIDEQIQVNVNLVVLGNPKADITGVRIRDNRREVWFSPYPEGEAVSCLSGANAITVVFEIKNVGEISGTIFGRMIDSDGRLLLDKSLGLDVEQLSAFEATFDMPNHSITLTIIAGHGAPPSGQYTIAIGSNLPPEVATTIPSGNITQDSGTTLEVNANEEVDFYINDVYYYAYFDHWELDDEIYSYDNLVTVTFDANHTLKAIYHVYW